MKFIVLAICLLIAKISMAQYKATFIVQDSLTQEPIDNAYLSITSSSKAAITNSNGSTMLLDLKEGTYSITVRCLSYRPKTILLEIPLPTDSPIQVRLFNLNEVEDVIISTTRTNSRVENLPTKVEVLGQEDMNEESTIVPGNVSSILGDLAIITVQRMNPVNGNDAIRMQGLDARYTQLMRDGMPLYSGFSGSLGVLAIPPLDLKQIEIIKGSASTLYGGGAIGGLINFISKTPVEHPEVTILFNTTTLKEGNMNAYFSDKKKNKGYTFFAGATSKQPIDVNSDGFSDVIYNKNILIHPRFFWDLNKHVKVCLGYTSNFDYRKGGDMEAIKNGTDSIYTFLQKEDSWRNTVDLDYKNDLNTTLALSVKSAASYYKRNINNSGVDFNAGQLASYNEINLVKNGHKHIFVSGVNFAGENFNKRTSNSVIKDYHYATLGAFLQDNWQFTKKISAQLGLRADHHNMYGEFLLPRISIFMQPNQAWGVRLAAGSGYKTPNLFDYVLPTETALKFASDVKAEKARGLNGDISYKAIIFDKIKLQIDEALYYSEISNPIQWMKDTLNNSSNAQKSVGTDTYIRVKYDKLELYLGYNHTEAFQQLAGQRLNAPFNPKDKFSATLAYEIEGTWRFGLESSYSGNQFIYNNQKVHSIWFVAMMAERKFKKSSLVLNCENVLDQRQSRFESIVTGSRSSPSFKPLWATTEGRVINLSYKFSFVK